LTPVTFGRAIITTENMGVKDFTVVEVSAPNGVPLPPEDITAQLDIQRSGIRLNRRSGFFIQRITLTNPSALPIPGPLALILEGLPAGVTAVNRDSDTDRVLAGSAEFDIAVDQRLNSLLPGATVTFDVEFVNPERKRISYTPHVFVAQDF